MSTDKIEIVIEIKDGLVVSVSGNRPSSEVEIYVVDHDTEEDDIIAELLETGIVIEGGEVNTDRFPYSLYGG